MRDIDPSTMPCIKGKQHSIGMFSGVCSNCRKRFWDEWQANRDGTTTINKRRGSDVANKTMGRQCSL